MKRGHGNLSLARWENEDGPTGMFDRITALFRAKPLLFSFIFLPLIQHSPIPVPCFISSFFHFTVSLHLYPSCHVLTFHLSDPTLSFIYLLLHIYMGFLSLCLVPFIHFFTLSSIHHPSDSFHSLSPTHPKFLVATSCSNNLIGFLRPWAPTSTHTNIPYKMRHPPYQQADTTH
jgi:hypothetical protein